MGSLYKCVAECSSYLLVGRGNVFVNEIKKEQRDRGL
jgi:hypothetical protein